MGILYLPMVVWGVISSASGTGFKSDVAGGRSTMGSFAGVLIETSQSHNNPGLIKKGLAVYTYHT